jgi:predicted TIM-barrel fold metal-dependent hydrolase
VARLADYGWSFDLQVFAGQMDGAAELAASCPRVTFVLQHCGMLEDTSLAGRAGWRAGMARLSREPNVYSKVSGLGTFLHRVDPAHIVLVVAETVALFGASRCLFGSNFPIEKLWSRYGELLAAHRAAVAALPPSERQAIFHDTAARIYRIRTTGQRPRVN